MLHVDEAKPITDIHVATRPALNTNYFRLGAKDSVNQHADDSPGRAVCMLLYSNEHCQEHQSGEWVFIGLDYHSVAIAPFFNNTKSQKGCSLFADDTYKG
jgi:hypothetical protein